MFRSISVARLAACSTVAISFLIPGCGGGGHHSGTGGPNGPTNPSQSASTFSVTGIVPASGATGVSLDASIHITFSAAADASTVNTTNIRVTNPNAVAGTVTYDNTSKTATFTPAAPLVANSTYTVAVSGVTSSDGTGLASPYKSTFATVTSSSGGGGSGGGGGGGGGGGTAETFSVSSVWPANGATQVALNATIKITFSSAADPATVTAANIRLTDPQSVAGTVSYDASTNTATFTPSTSLVPNSTYTVTVSGVKSSDGTALSAPFTSNFATIVPGTVPGAGATQYQNTLSPSHNNPGTGSVSIDTYGDTTVQLTGAVASASFTVQFCPAYPVPSQNPPACFAVSTIATDANGNGTKTVRFPQPGSWAGDFQLISNGAVAYLTDITVGSNAGGYQATLQPQSTVNGKGITSASPQDPLATGTIDYSKGMLTFTITGASPNTTYSAVENILLLGSSSSYLLYNAQHESGFTTDSKGNVTFTVLQDGINGDLFEVDPSNNSAGFIGGFSIQNP